MQMWESLDFRNEWKKRLDELGLRTPDDKLTKKDLYYREVDYYTNKSLKEFYNIINPDNKKIGKTTGLYSIDHKYSKIMGFNNNIDPKIIGSYINLQTITFSENSKKRKNCSILLEELLKLYEESLTA